MPGAGAVQVTIVVLCCLQVDGGSRPLAPPLSFASVSALISALGGWAFGLAEADMEDMAIPPACAFDPPLTRAQVPRPAATRTSAVSAAIHPGRANQRRDGSRRPGAGGCGSAAAGADGGGSLAARRCETIVSPCRARPAGVPAGTPSADSGGGVSPTGVSPGGVSPTGVSPGGVSADGVAPDGMEAGGTIVGAVARLPRATRAASMNSRQLP